MPAETIDGSLPLEQALNRLQLDGAIFFRSEFTEAWSFSSPAAAGEFAHAVEPRADRLIMFHIVAKGSCWVAGPDGERHRANEGDVIVLPYGDEYEMGGTATSESVPIFSLLAPPPWTTLPVLRHGGDGSRTDVVCGYLHSQDPLFDPKMRALPSVFVVRLDEAAQRWVRASIDYALAVSSGTAVSDAASKRLPELLLIEMLRLHLGSAPSAEHGWISALHDPALAPALACLHARPEHPWTVSELAHEAAVSRSLLDQRFRDVLGLSPIRYLTEWRMHLATELLDSTDHTVAQIGKRTGYDSQEAFSRAFKRRMGSSPSRWRTERRTGTS
ncbi:MAG TPA: AraC family transcriptional regulator [Actinomycetota bacterium]|nr:AraC family transcriptional regulator [Actinomycetota bacterium]